MTPTTALKALSIPALTAVVMVGSSQATIGADAPCRVRNVTRSTNGISLLHMVERSQDGDRLKVRGTCAGTVVIRADITVQGIDGAVLTGERKREVVDVRRRATVILRDLVIARGRSRYFDGVPPAGGGIYNAGTLTLVRSTVRRNRIANAGFEGAGGGIYNDGTLTLVASTVRGNSADEGSGGGIAGYGTLILTGSTVSGNAADSWGGGIDNRGAVTLTDSVVRGNSARSEGGGILNEGSLTLIGSTVTANTAGAEGGGIYNYDDPDYPEDSGTVTLDGASSVSGNMPDDCVGTPAC